MKLFLWIDGKQDGPFEPEQIRAMLNGGSITAVTLGCPDDGTGEWKPISSYEEIVEPPQCSEPTPVLTTAPALDPPAKKPKFRWKPIAISFAVVGLILAMAGYVQYRRACKAVQDELVEYHQIENPSLDTLRTNAINSIREDCSNEVVGLSRIVRVSMMDFDESPSKWSGTATCEFVNKVGGVERVERRYRISIVPNSTGGIGGVFAHEDPKAFYDELERIANQK
jgi:hypothetical protein